MDDRAKELAINLQNSPEIRKYLSQRRFILFSRMHEIVFHGNGGYDLDTIYNLPIWLRNFIYHQINEHYKAQLERASNTGGQTLTNSAPVKKTRTTPREAAITVKRSARK